MVKYTQMLKVKICGITNRNDALAAVEYGADGLGFIFYQGSPRAVPPETARDIISSLPPFISTIGVFVNEDRVNILKILSYTGIDIIQFHGSESADDCRIGKKFIKAIRVKELSDLDPLVMYQDAAAFLLDAYSPDTIGHGSASAIPGRSV